MFRFLSRLWAADPDSRRDARRREEQARIRRQEQVEQREREERKDANEILTIVIVSEEIRRACEELQRDIADAIRVTRIAYNHAVRDQEAAREALELAQRNSLVLLDGRRVYFTADGRLLYGEDHHEITDRTAINEARRLHRAHSDATTSEAYFARWNDFTDANERVQRLAMALDKLDDLEQQVAAGIATEDQIAETRGALEEVLTELPAEVRRERDHIREQREAPPPLTRQGDYRSARTLVTLLPEITAEDLESAGVADREPVYIPVPKP